MTCTCPFCEKHRRIDEIVNSKDIDKMAYLIRELEDDLVNIQSDNDRLKAILDGSWPSAREILKNAWYKLPIEEMKHPMIKELFKLLGEKSKEIRTLPDGSITAE